MVADPVDNLSEREFQAQVIELAQMLRWKVAHFRAAQTSKGWRTPVSADGKGFPDLVMVRGYALIFAELKAQKGKLSPEQGEWIDALRPLEPSVMNEEWSPVHVYVWRPSDWDEIQRVLR